MLELVTTCQMWFLFFISSQSWLHCIYNEIQYFHDSPPHLTLIECFAVFLFPNWDLGDSCQFAAQIGSSVGQMPGSQRHRCHSGLSRIKCDTCHPRLIYLSDSDMTMLYMKSLQRELWDYVGTNPKQIRPKPTTWCLFTKLFSEMRQWLVMQTTGAPYGLHIFITENGNMENNNTV